LSFHANIGLDGNPESDLFSDMASFKKPDPELLPIGRPRCPDCSMRMLTVDIVAGPEGFEHRTFECSRCGHSEKKVLTCDPLKSNAIGWLASELKPPA
jgi:DNA-directed RNA polymerase subunit RPC12/RpoP